MTELGRDTQNDRVVPDIVFASRPAGTEDDSVTPPSTSTGALTVGVDVMGYYGWEAGDPRAEEIHDGYVAKLVHFIRYLLDAGHRVQLLLAQRNDELTIDEVLDALGGHDHLPANLEWKPIADFQSLRTTVAQCDLAVVTRYHALIATVIAGRPAISIGYAEKNDAIMARAGLSDFCRFIETFEVDDLERQFDRLTAERLNRAADVRRFVEDEGEAATSELRRACAVALGYAEGMKV